VVSVLASGTQDHGFKPGQSRQIFRAKKSLAHLPSEQKSQICGMLKTPGNYVEVEFFRRNLSAISRPFLFLATGGLQCYLLLTGGTKGSAQRAC
jgi:hypothetical protein